GVYCEIVPFNRAEAAFQEKRPRAIVLSGGPASLTEALTPRVPQALLESGLPILGICYGEQAICAQLGGGVEASDHREFGRAFVEVVESSPLFEGVWVKGSRHQVWM